MAEKIVIELDLDKGDVKGATAALEKSAKKSGEKSGLEFAKQFNRNAGERITNLSKSLLKATSLVTGLGAAFATAIGIKGVQAAQVQEDAINALNSALTISKNASLEASQGIQTFASELQQSTRFGDELLIQNAALIQSLGDLDEQGLKRATAAAADLATALRIDLNAAATLVGKAAAGEVGSFSRYGLSIKKGADNAETFAKALTAIENKFGGAAQRDVNTFSGAVDQLSNAFGDTFEEIGKIITQNPAFVKALQFGKELFEDASKAIIDFRGGFDFFATATNLFVNFNDSFITFVISPVEQLINIFSVAQNAINTFASGAIAAYGQIALGLSKVLDIVGVEGEISQGLKDFSETSKQVLADNAQSLENSLSSVFDFPISDKLSQKNEELRNFFEQSKALAQENTLLNDELANNAQEKAQAQVDFYKTLYSELTNVTDANIAATQAQVEAANTSVTNFAKNSAKQLRDGFGRAAGAAFAEFGKGVAEGNASLADFGKVLFKSLAQSAVALGTNFILEGTAYLFSANPALAAKGPGLISSGAALAAFGGFLGASVGGGGSASAGAGASTASAGGNVFAQDTEELASPTTPLAEERVNLSLNVGGSLVRESELEGYVANILEEGASRNATIIPSLRTA